MRSPGSVRTLAYNAMDQAVSHPSRLRIHPDSDNEGSVQRFIDPAVYTRSRQFRLPLCYKLSDRSRTGLSLPSPPLVSTFGRACISKIDSYA